MLAPAGLALRSNWMAGVHLGSFLLFPFLESFCFCSAFAVLFLKPPFAVACRLRLAPYSPDESQQFTPNGRNDLPLGLAGRPQSS